MKALTSCILVFLLLTIQFRTTVEMNPTTNIESHNELILSDSGYNETSPIQIDNDDDFQTQAASNNWSGNGTNKNPYSITKINVTSSSGSISLIHIRDTTAHFILQDSLLVGGLYGIRLDNVTNGHFRNNTIRDSISRGVYSTSGKVNYFENNTIYNIITGGVGMYIYDCENSTISNNTIRDNAQHGVLMDYCENSSVIENRFVNNDHTGIYLRDSDRNLVYRNNITESIDGIVFGGCLYSNVTGNIVTKTSGNGIGLGDCGSSTIVSNLLYNNTGCGMGVWGPSHKVENNTFYNNLLGFETNEQSCEIRYNNFIDNTNQANIYNYPNGSHNNFLEYNYWSDWTWPDANNDGICDNIYIRYDNFNDSKPVIDPYFEARLHVLSTPVIFIPGEWIFGLAIETNVTWGKVGDTFGHEALYTLYYSANGSDWILIVSDLDVNTYLWNLTSLPTDNYTIRVIASCLEGLTSDAVSMHDYLITKHILSAPTILTPNGGEVFIKDDGNIVIQWTSAVDTLMHTVNYIIYFSSDGGNSWTQIGNLSSHYFEWNPSNQTPGSDFLIRVVAMCDGGLVLEDLSDGHFTLEEQVVPVTTTTTTTTTTTDNGENDSDYVIPMVSAIIIVIAVVLVILFKRRGLR